MKVIAKAGNDDIACVFIASNDSGKMFEFAQSLTPPSTRLEKWVFLISTAYGCPIKCRFCDAGTEYFGILSKNEMIFQIKYLLEKYNGYDFSCKKLKIQFARVGEPSFNINVIEVIKELEKVAYSHVIYPSISTVAPYGRDLFFEELLKVKKELYPLRFQLQFSIHSTEEDFRDRLMPIKKWNLNKISEYGERFFDSGGRKITLNFIYSPDFPVDVYKIVDMFSPEKFLIKITPINPTIKSIENNLYHDFIYDENVWFRQLERKGFEVLVSIGELEENKIGSNCGQYINYFKKRNIKVSDSYTYEIFSV